MKKLFGFLLIILIIFGGVKQALATPKISGSPEFIKDVNSAFSLLKEKDIGVYNQIDSVANIKDSGCRNGVMASSMDGVINFNMGLMKLKLGNSWYPFFVGALSHELNHVVTPEDKLDKIASETTALKQQILTLRLIGAPQFIINKYEYILNNIDDFF